MVLSADGRQYKKDVAAVADMADTAGSGWPKDGAMKVYLHVYRPRKSGDLDNTMKGIFDALNGIVWTDDSQVVEIHAYRHDDKSRPRVEVLASECV